MKKGLAHTFFPQADLVRSNPAYHFSGSTDVLLYTYDSWGCFQPASLITPNVAQTTFAARTDGLLWAISCTEFRSLASTHDKALLTAKTAYLLQLPYISDLPSADKNKLVDGVDFLRFKRGT